MKKRKLTKNIKRKSGNNFGRKNHISYSQIQNGRCLFRYKMINLLNQIKIGSVAMVEGSIVHNIIYDYTRECFEKHFDSDFETMELIVDKRFKTSKLPESTFRSVREKMLEFAERDVSWEIILAFEKRFKVNIGRDVMIEGVIDRANSYKTEDGKNSVLEIVDYKNQMNIVTQQDVEENLQLQLYKYIACNFLFTGFDMVRVGIYHTRYNFVRWGEMRPVIDLGKEFENNEKYLHRQWERLILSTDDMYEPTKCEACWEYGGCEVMLQGKCPLYTKKEVERLKKSTIADKVRALRLLDIQARILKDTLKEHFNTHEPIDIDGSQVGIIPSFSYKYDLLPFYKWAMKNDVPLNQISLTKTDVEKAIKKVTGLAELSPKELKILDDMKISNSTNRFRY